MTTCSRCNRDINGHATLFVNGISYCFRCARLSKKEIDKQNEKIVADEYRPKLRQYEEAERIFKQQHAEWLSRRNEYIIPQSWTASTIFTWVIVITVFLSLLHPAVGILSGIVCWFIFISKANDEEIERGNEFCRLNPEPQFTMERPKPCHIPEAEITSPHKNDDNGPKGFNRLKILERDRYVCQKCRKRFSEDQLEVHHIVPRSDGGSNTIENLVTLCIKCHDLEDLFGHTRAYAKHRKPEKYKYNRYAWW